MHIDKLNVYIDLMSERHIMNKNKKEKKTLEFNACLFSILNPVILELPTEVKNDF